MEIVIVWLICGIGAAMIAHSKGRNSFAWFIVGILLGPLSLLIVGFMAPLVSYETVKIVNSNQTNKQIEPRKVKCPYCAELIMPDAKICRFCGNGISNNLVSTKNEKIEFRTCSKCYKSITDQAIKVCSRCGTSLDSNN